MYNTRVLCYIWSLAFDRGVLGLGDWPDGPHSQALITWSCSPVFLVIPLLLLVISNVTRRYPYPSQSIISNPLIAYATTSVSDVVILHLSSTSSFLSIFHFSFLPFYLFLCFLYFLSLFYIFLSVFSLCFLFLFLPLSLFSVFSILHHIASLSFSSFCLSFLICSLLQWWLQLVMEWLMMLQ